MNLISRSEMAELQELIKNRHHYECSDDEVREALADLLQLLRAGYTLVSSDGMFSYKLRKRAGREYLTAFDECEISGTLYYLLHRAWRRVEIASVVVELIEAKSSEILSISEIQKRIEAAVS